jgi:hypothetical protein
MEKEFVPYELAVKLKELGFDEPCFGYYDEGGNLYTEMVEVLKAPLYQQAINFLYICSNKQIDIELKGSDTYEERIRKIEQGCKDLWNLQNNKSN